MELKNQNSSDLIFPNKKGKHRLQSSVAQTWRGYKQKRTLTDGTEVDYYYLGVVAKLAKEGAISGYFSPYHTRHTYITLTAEANSYNNNALLHIATACGNSVDVILRHYLGVSEEARIVEV